jgi:hypothetical protein
MPRIKPPEPTFSAPPAYQRTTYQQGTYGRPPAHLGAAAAPTVTSPPPTLQGRTGKALKWTVAALLIAALGLGSWQAADRLLDRNDQPGVPSPSGSATGSAGAHAAPRSPKPINIVSAQDFDPLGDKSEKPAQIKNSYDNDLETFWSTDTYYTDPNFGRLKSGVGIMLDLGKSQPVGEVDVSFLGGDTSVALMAASRGQTERPTSLSGFTKVTEGSGTKVALKPGKPVQTRYVLVWLTKLPPVGGGGFRGKISEIHITG